MTLVDDLLVAAYKAYAVTIGIILVTIVVDRYLIQIFPRPIMKTRRKLE